MYSQTLKIFFQRAESYICNGYPATNNNTSITSSFFTECFGIYRKYSDFRLLGL